VRIRDGDRVIRSFFTATNVISSVNTRLHEYSNLVSLTSFLGAYVPELVYKNIIRNEILWIAKNNANKGLGGLQTCSGFLYSKRK